eukprot:GHVN01107300.1.p1 GENE.GHVN01107300.1~~GHVN01107300.1.p1  ORF type:complete len:873 (-),score=145.85 GHVN01107300.1:137-2755(-)
MDDRYKRNHYHDGDGRRDARNFRDDRNFREHDFDRFKRFDRREWRGSANSYNQAHKEHITASDNGQRGDTAARGRSRSRERFSNASRDSSPPPGEPTNEPEVVEENDDDFLERRRLQREALKAKYQQQTAEKQESDHAGEVFIEKQSEPASEGVERHTSTPPFVNDVSHGVRNSNIPFKDSDSPTGRYPQDEDGEGHSLKDKQLKQRQGSKQSMGTQRKDGKDDEGGKPVEECPRSGVSDEKVNITETEVASTSPSTGVASQNGNATKNFAPLQLAPPSSGAVFSMENSKGGNDNDNEGALRANSEASIASQDRDHGSLSSNPCNEVVTKDGGDCLEKASSDSRDDASKYTTQAPIIAQGDGKGEASPVSSNEGEAADTDTSIPGSRSASQAAGEGALTNEQLKELMDKLDKSRSRIKTFVKRERERKEHEKDHQNPSGGSSSSNDDTANYDPLKTLMTCGGEVGGEDEFDMFAVDPTAGRSRNRASVGNQAKLAGAGLQLDVETLNNNLSLADNWDDEEGYLQERIGEIMNNRYEVVSCAGKGVYSTVLKCKDLKPSSSTSSETQKLVAVKVIRNNGMMRQVAEREVYLLHKLNISEKEDRRHVVRFLSSFDYKGHFCLVFEWMWGSLRLALKTVLNGKHIHPYHLQAYTRQLFKGLRHMRRNGIIHADLKPDNILINSGHNVLKICDFGSAAEENDNEITEYLVSRFYRAPEIMLGCKPDFQVDVWSAAVSLYEIASGEVLFQGRTNNDMLKCIMDAKGKMPHKLIRSGAFRDKHFDESLDFMWRCKDTYTGRDITKRILQFEGRNIGDILAGKCQWQTAKAAQYRKKMKQFGEFLGKCLVLDPSKRMTPDQALCHPWLAEHVDKPKGGH